MFVFCSKNYFLSRFSSPYWSMTSWCDDIFFIEVFFSLLVSMGSWCDDMCACRMEEGAREALWFKMLDALFESLKTLRVQLKQSAPEYTKIIRDLARYDLPPSTH